MIQKEIDRLEPGDHLIWPDDTRSFDTISVFLKEVKTEVPEGMPGHIRYCVASNGKIRKLGSSSLELARKATYNEIITYYELLTGIRAAAPKLKDLNPK